MRGDLARAKFATVQNRMSSIDERMCNEYTKWNTYVHFENKCGSWKLICWLKFQRKFPILFEWTRHHFQIPVISFPLNRHLQIPWLQIHNQWWVSQWCCLFIQIRRRIRCFTIYICSLSHSSVLAFLHSTHLLILISLRQKP